MIKKPFPPLVIGAALLIFTFMFGVGSGWIIKILITPDANVQTFSSIKEAPGSVSDHQMEKELVKMDMQDIGGNAGLSKRQQEQYLAYIETASTKYEVPMILIHSIICGESGYNPSAPHPKITVAGRTTYALSLMGVVWEYNHAALEKEGIAMSRLELTEPEVNINAGTFILRLNIQDIFRKNPRLSEDRFFDELVRRYYGAYDETYKNRVLTKIKDMASRQWINRVVKNILAKYKITLVDGPSMEVEKMKVLSSAGVASPKHRLDSLKTKY